MSRSRLQPRAASRPAPAASIPIQEAEAPVSSCVTSIVQAFTRGFDVFKRLRGLRRRKKDGKRREKSDDQDVSPEEMRLSKSLGRAPGEIWGEYEKGVGGVGEVFRRGDAIAHASLASTLLKLNTGLVNIITAFIGHGDKASKDLDLDYKSLTDLSEASRAEAIRSLNQLYYRLSQSNIMLVSLPQLKAPTIPVCAKCQKPTCPGCSEKKKKGDKTSNRTNPPHRHRRRGSDTSTVITRMPLGGKAGSQSQLVIVRPKAHRKNSSTSTASSSSSQPTSPSIGTGQISPISAISAPFSSAKQPYPPISPPLETTPRPDPRTPKTKSKPKPGTTPYIQSTQPSPSPSPIPLPLRRRTDKLTPSTYTFASDSTKLGEIPMRNWIDGSWDFEDAERRNREERGVVLVPVEEGEGDGKKRGRGWGFWRRGE